MKKLKFIRFHAIWCGPCKMFEKTFQKLKEEPGFENDIFLEYDVDNHPEEVEKYGVMSVPTTTVIDAETGEFLTNIIGNIQLQQLVATIADFR